MSNGVLGRLSKLTSKNKKLDRTTGDKIYPCHTTVLQIVGIAPKLFPIFLELIKLRIKFTKSEKELKKREKEAHFFVLVSASVCNTHTLSTH